MQNACGHASAADMLTDRMGGYSSGWNTPAIADAQAALYINTDAALKGGYAFVNFCKASATSTFNSLNRYDQTATREYPPDPANAALATPTQRANEMCRKMMSVEWFAIALETKMTSPGAWCTDDTLEIPMDTVARYTNWAMCAIIKDYGQTAQGSNVVLGVGIDAGGLDAWYDIIIQEAGAIAAATDAQISAGGLSC